MQYSKISSLNVVAMQICIQLPIPVHIYALFAPTYADCINRFIFYCTPHIASSIFSCKCA
jgi:hypothetical protein